MFRNREHAGVLLARKIQEEIALKSAVVLGITRGGAVVGKKVAEELRLPFDIIAIKKIGAPFNPERAIGAVGPLGTVYWDRLTIENHGISDEILKKLFILKKKAQEEQDLKFKKERKALDITGKKIILVDDGVASGATVLAAQKYLRNKAKELILATPVIFKDTFDDIKIYFDSIVSILNESDFNGVSSFYYEFDSISDEEVKKLL